MFHRRLLLKEKEDDKDFRRALDKAFNSISIHSPCFLTCNLLVDSFLCSSIRCIMGFGLRRCVWRFAKRYKLCRKR